MHYIQKVGFTEEHFAQPGSQIDGYVTLLYVTATWDVEDLNVIQAEAVQVSQLL